MNAIQAKQIRITSYLNGEGIRPTKIHGDVFWYCSPFRQEKTPSFKVNDRANIWYDHGLGQGGNILDLVMAMHRLENISQALGKLSERMTYTPSKSFSFQQQKTSSGIVILTITPLSNSTLVEYIKSRHINLETARIYCKDIYYTVNDKNYFSVGFRNDSGGYELNSPPNFKSCIPPKAITTYRNGNDICLVFEGFWDFLSYLTIQKIERTKNDVAVLNSVANVQKAMNFLQTHKEIYTYLDNDEGGRKATEIIKSTCLSINDRSERYTGFKDLNDYLCQKPMVEPEVKKKKMGIRR